MRADFQMGNCQRRGSASEDIPVTNQPEFAKAHELALAKLRAMWSLDIRVTNPDFKKQGLKIDWSRVSEEDRWARIYQRKMQSHYTNLRSEILKHIKKMRLELRRQ
jgi:hypothetical protein